MLVGAVNAVFRISQWDSFMMNIIPILFFILVCYTLKNDFQIFCAQVLSAAYCLLMMAVFVGQAIQMTEDGLGSPSAIFFMSLTGSFIVAGLLHPQEITCLGPLLLYFLSIPCMYLLLIIYSLVNLNVVTWGTREVQSKKTKKELEEEKKVQEEIKQKSLLGFLNMGEGRQEEGSITFSLANLFKCQLFTYPKPNDETIHLIKIQDQLETINSKLSHLEKVEKQKLTQEKAIVKQLGRQLPTVNECFTDEEEQSLLDGETGRHRTRSESGHHGDHRHEDKSSTSSSDDNSLKVSIQYVYFQF